MKQSIELSTEIDLKKLIKGSKLNQKQLAMRLRISEQWLIKLLKKPTDELSIKLLANIVHHLGYKLIVKITS